MSTEYGISPVDYWHRFKRNVEHHNATQDRAFLFYAALECRFTIEAVMFDNGRRRAQRRELAGHQG